MPIALVSAARRLMPIVTSRLVCLCQHKERAADVLLGHIHHLRFSGPCAPSCSWTCHVRSAAQRLPSKQPAARFMHQAAGPQRGRAGTLLPPIALACLAGRLARQGALLRCFIKALPRQGLLSRCFLEVLYLKVLYRGALSGCFISRCFLKVLSRGVFFSGCFIYKAPSSRCFINKTPQGALQGALSGCFIEKSSL